MSLEFLGLELVFDLQFRVRFGVALGCRGLDLRASGLAT